MANGTELGKAYVQIMPSAQGIGAATSKLLSGEMGSAGSASGKLFGSALIKAATTAISAAGIGAIIGKAITEGAALEQSLGGVEAIFGDAADSVIANANNAFKTAGVSANQYMEGVTSFAASLMQSTGGNAQQAADVADKAFRDMSDNANRFGTDMGSIQAAYQGFAKQNYTMLDNLKLGYGGTKTEMERLLKDAQAITGVEYNIDNLADVYTAIGVIQDSLNVTGTTAREAATTFSGSLSMMKASVSNFLGALGTGENVAPALQGLLESVGYFAGNALRMLLNVFTSIPTALAGVDWVGIATTLFTNLKEALGAQSGILSMDGTTVVAFVNGILSNLPQLITTAGQMLSTFVGYILDNLPTVISSGVEILLGLVSGIINNLPAIASAAFNALANFRASVAERLPAIFQTGIEMLGKLAAGLINAIPTLVAMIPQIIRAAVNAFQQHDWSSTGRAIIDGIVNGIRNAGHLIADALKNLARSAWQGVKNILGIGSPSKVFANEVGRWIPAGIAQGIKANAGTVTEALDAVAGNAVTVSQDVLVNRSMRRAEAAPLADVLGALGNTEGITVNVYGSDNMSVEDLADAVQRRIIELQNRRRYAWL